MSVLPSIPNANQSDFDLETLLRLLKANQCKCDHRSYLLTNYASANRQTAPPPVLVIWISRS